MKRSSQHAQERRPVVLSGGSADQAQKIYNELRTRYPTFEEFQVSLDQFAKSRIIEEFDGLGIHDASEQVVSLLINAYRLYAVVDDDAASANEQLSQQVWDYYKAKYGDNERIDLPPMPNLEVRSRSISS